MDRRGRVAEAVRAVADAVSRLDRALPDTASLLTQEDWLQVVETSQGRVNRLTGIQDVAIASASRFEGTSEDDGTVGSVDRGPGRVALDAADLVAPRLGASHHQAQGRVETAVRLTGRTPAPPEVEERPQRTGLDGLHSAMRAGRLDRYRAGVVADELLEAPAPVADAVVAALDPHLDAEPAPELRRRTRRLLARISPDLLRQRAQRARRETGLRRWVAEPGVDAWYGTFPSEASAAAWAAVDRLARRYITEGVCTTIEQARGQALTDLVLEHSDVRVQLVLTTPADVPAEVAALDESADVPAEAVALDEPAIGPATEPVRPSSSAEQAHPGPVAERVGNAASQEPSAPEPAADVPAAECGSRVGTSGAAEDLVQVHGVRPSEPVLVHRGWLEQVVVDRGTEIVEVRCHPSTGARVDDGGVLGRDGYRPGDPLTDLVKARDGHCRFPGCSVAARFCDLDHVRPWPIGPTAATNLLTLCRHHHRIKQAPGWRVRLRDDGVAEWTDPTGTTTCTYPIDALDRLVLPAELGETVQAATAPAATAAAVTTTAAGAATAAVAITSSVTPVHALPTLPSVLEEALDHRLDQHDAQLRHHRGCCRRVSDLTAAFVRQRRRHPERSSGDPPF